MIDLNKTETPEEKEALDMVEKYTHKFTPAEAMPKDIAAIFDNDNAQFESLAVEVNSNPVWNGEGWPPVGIECWFNWRHGCDEKCALTYKGDGVFCYVDHKGKEFAAATGAIVGFGRIETPEQKAARERDEEIADMSNRIGLTIQICEKLYDSGYRRMK